MTGSCEKWRLPSAIPNLYLQRTVGIKLEKINGLYVIVFVWHRSELCRLMDILVKTNAFLNYSPGSSLESFSDHQKKYTEMFP